MDTTSVTPAKSEPSPTMQSVTPIVEPDAPAEVVPLPDVLRQIGRDSTDAPRRYLEETRVPYGGE
jgi:hypothetical protein